MAMGIAQYVPVTKKNQIRPFPNNKNVIIAVSNENSETDSSSSSCSSNNNDLIGEKNLILKC